jgi:hypothetical protein
MMKGESLLMKHVIHQTAHRLSIPGHARVVALLPFLLLVLFLVTACGKMM